MLRDARAGGHAGGGGSYVRLAISQSPGYSRANPMLEGQEIWQHTFKLNV